MEISQRLKFLQRSAKSLQRMLACDAVMDEMHIYSRNRIWFMIRGNERRQVSRNNVTRLKLISSYIVRKVSRDTRYYSFTPRA